MTTAITPMPRSPKLPTGHSTSPFDFEKAAKPVFNQLARSARRHEGLATWLTPDEKEIDSNLYSGSVGIALSLALWGKFTRNEMALRLAEETLELPRRRSRKLIEKLENPSTPARPYLGGGFSSLGSIIYGLAQIAGILDSKELAEEAEQLASLVTPELIEKQANCGLSDGVAGLTLALMAAAKSAEHFQLSHQIADSVSACGARLRTFLDQEDRPCAPGLAQGLSGVAYALGRLHEVFPDDHWHWDAHSALAQERRLFDGVQRTWRIPHSDEMVSQNSWSQGPAGMLLARSALVHRGIYPADPVSEADLDIVLRLTRKQAARRQDALDGGNLGHALILQRAGLWLNAPELVADAKQIGRTVASRCPDSLFIESCRLDYGPAIRDAGFMTGLAGVIYALLRLSHNNVPCLLLME